MQHEHAQRGRAFLELHRPDIEHGLRTHDEHGQVRAVGFFARAQPQHPGDGLQCFAQAHVIGQDATKTV